MNVSIKHEDAPTPAETAAAEAAIEKSGFGWGTLSVTIHEEKDARDARDAAIASAASTVRLTEYMLVAEKKLRDEVVQLQVALNKERSARIEERIAAAREIAALRQESTRLEKLLTRQPKSETKSGPRRKPRR